MGLLTLDQLKSLDYSFLAQPFCVVLVNDDINLKGMDYGFYAQPFVVCFHPSFSESMSPSISPSSSISASISPSISPSSSISASISPSISSSISASISSSISASVSPSISPSSSISESISPSISPSISTSRSPSISPSISESISESISPSISESISESASISASISPSISPSISESASISASISPSVSSSISESISPSSSISASISPSTSVSASEPEPSSYTIKTGIKEGGATFSGRHLARSSNGDLHCVWTDRRGTYSQIYYAKSTDSGQNWTETAITSENYNQENPSIAIDSNNYIHITWDGKHSSSTSYTQIRYVKYDGSWGSIQNLTSDNCYQCNPSIAIDSNDHVHTVWYSYNSSNGHCQIRYINYDSSWSSIQNLSSDDYNNADPLIAIDSNNHIHVVWYGKYSGSSSVYQIRYIKYDGSWGSVQNLTSEERNQSYPSIAIDSNDCVHITWCSIYGEAAYYDQIRYIKYDSSWGDIQDVVTSEDYYQFCPSIAIDSNNYIHIVWYGYYSGSTNYCQIRYIKYDSSWRSVQNLTSDNADQQYPVLIWARYPVASGYKTNRPKNGYAFVWTDTSGDQSIKYYASGNLEWGVSHSASTSASTSLSISPSISPSISESASISASISPSVSSSISESTSPSVSESASISASISPSVSSFISASISPSISPSISASVSPSVSESASISASISPSISPSSSISASISPSISSSISASISQSISPSSSISASISPSISASISPSISESASISASVSPSTSQSKSPSVSPSLSPSISPSASPSFQPAKLLYKLYTEDGTYITTLSDIISDLSITKEINGGDSAFTFTIARKVDDFGENIDIDFNYRVKVYLFDENNFDGKLIAYGYIVSYEPYFKNREEGVTVTCLSAISKLSNDYYRLGTSALAAELGVELSNMRADEMMAKVIEHYREVESNSMIAEPTGLDITTDNAGVPFYFTLRLFNKKHLEALKEISKYFARYKTNGYWFYWRIDTAGNLIVKNISQTAKHKFVIGKHITSITGQKTIENLVNRVYFWNEKGSTSSEYVKLTIDDNTSQNEYDIVSAYINDSSITNPTAAALLSSARVYDNKDPKVKIQIELNSTYDLSSIEPGDTCQIFNLKNNPYKLGSDSVLFIHSITYEVDHATLEIAEAADDFTDMVQEERNRLTDELTWFGYISQDITASQLGPANRTWTTDISFTASSDSNAYRKITWTSGIIYLSTSIANSAGRRVIAAGDTGNMLAATPYYLYLNEETINTNASAELTGTGIIQQGAEYLTDSSKSWINNQWAGYIVTIGGQTRIIRSNTLTVLNLEEAWTIKDTTDTYVIRKMTLDVTTDKSAVASSSNVIFATAKSSDNTEAEASVNSVDGTSVLIDGDTQIAYNSIPSSNINGLYVDKLLTGTINSKRITLSSDYGNCYINSGKTSFTDTANGFILGLDYYDHNYAKLIIGNATHYLSWNGTNLTLYGGYITADAGYIGGWAITSNSLTSVDNGIILYSNNEKITVGATNPIIIDGINKKIESNNYASGITGSGFHIDENFAEFGNVAVRGIIRTSVFQKDNVSVMGGNFIVQDGDILAHDMLYNDTTLTIEGNTTFAVNDILRIKNGINEEWFVVTNTSSAPTYTVSRSGSLTWQKGSTVVNYGQSGHGGVYMTASETHAPYLSVFTHSGTPWSSITTRLRIGNLNGFLGYSSDVYGVAIGESTKYLKYDPTNGLRIGGGKITLDTAGYISGGKTSFDNTTAGFIMGTDPTDSVVKFLIGNSTEYFNIIGDTLINTLKIPGYDVGNVTLASADTERSDTSTVYTERKRITVGRKGNYRIYFEYKAYNGGSPSQNRNAYFRVTYAPTWAAEIGEVCLRVPQGTTTNWASQYYDYNGAVYNQPFSLWVCGEGGVTTYFRNFRIKVNNIDEISGPTVVIN